jgi:hypothetical protein
MNHLSEELMISWINGDLDDDQVTTAEKHINDCNKCLLDFSLLMKSHKEIEGKIFEKAPKHVIERVKMELGLEKAPDISQGPIPIPTLGGRVFAHLTERGPVLYSIAAAILVLAVIIPILKDDGAEEEQSFPNKLLEQVQMPKVVSPTAKATIDGMQVTVKGNLLEITQPIKFPFTLKVLSISGTLLLKSELIDTENRLDLHSFKDLDSIKVVLTTLEEVIFDSTFVINKK